MIATWHLLGALLPQMNACELVFSNVVPLKIIKLLAVNTCAGGFHHLSPIIHKKQLYGLVDQWGPIIYKKIKVRITKSIYMTVFY